MGDSQDNAAGMLLAQPPVYWFDTGQRITFALRFDPVPRVLELDTPRVTIEAVGLHDDEETPHLAVGVQVILANEKEELARSITVSGSNTVRSA